MTAPMAIPQSARPAYLQQGWRWLLPALAGALGIALSMHTLSAVLPPLRWWTVLQQTAPAAVNELIFTQVALPRIVISWIVGASLGLAGVLFQQSLRNPLADPATIGVSSGAYLALVMASLFAPALLEWGAASVALAGGVLAAAVVLMVSRRSRFSTITVILAGLIVSLFCGAAGASLTLLNHEYLNGLFIWQTGSLVQNGWQNVHYLWPRILVLAVGAALMARPLGMLVLDDARVSALGVHVARVRLGALLLGVALCALSVSTVGVVGFIGLMAPNLVRLLGARTLRQRMALAPLLGALLLWLTDQIVQTITYFPNPIPAGSGSALVGAPVMLWLLFRQKSGLQARVVAHERMARRPRLSGRQVQLICAFLLAATVLAGLGSGRGPYGWEWFPATTLDTIIDWRLPRVAAAGIAGGMLAVAGMLLQRITGNPMASPEVLGISSGASLGIIAMLFVSVDLGAGGMLLAAFAGALLTLLLVLALNWRSGFSPERLLLAGVAISTILTAIAACLLTSGDPRTATLLTWMSGSTYRATLAGAAPAGAALALVFGLALAGARWLRILPLGEEAARALGLHVTMARGCFLMLIAAATAGATILVGPLSFIGLLAPHFVTALGLQRPRQQITAVALIGAGLMVCADWVGRNILYPWQVPAGLVAVLLGAPTFLYFLWRKQ